MTRSEEFKKKQEEESRSFLKDEIVKRARAAKILNERCDVGNITICEGAIDGVISVNSGFSDIAAIAGKQIYKVSDRKYAFYVEGTAFVWEDYLGLWSGKDIPPQPPQRESKPAEKEKVMPYDDD